MPNASEAKTDNLKEMLEQAYAVSDRIQLENVILAHCEAERAPEMSSRMDDGKLTTTVSQIAFGKDDNSSKLHLMVSFVLHVSGREKDEEDPPLRVKASFVLFYAVASFEGLSDDHFYSFGATNGMLNVWPYWRELVHSMTSRMGMPKPVVVPVFRLGQVKQAEQTTEDTL
jgi:preprotein translocase subunit SecB